MQHLLDLKGRLEAAYDALEQVRECLEGYNSINPTGGPMSLRHLGELEDDLEYLIGNYVTYIEDYTGRQVR